MTTDLKMNENNELYSAMLPALKQAQFGSFLILPFQFEENGFNSIWADTNLVPKNITTVDLNEIARSMMSKDGHMSIGSCWMVPRDVLFREMADVPLSGKQVSFRADTDSCSRSFSLTDSWLYMFHSQVAFFALGIVFDEIETLADIVNLGGVSSRAAFSYEDENGRHAFSLAAWIEQFASKAGLQPFFSSRGNPFMDVFTETLAVIPERFTDMAVMRQAAFNLHLMIPFTKPVTDNSEEDVRFIYAKAGEISHTYRWATCITSQTESYIVADPEMDLGKQLEVRGRAGLPVVMLALYEKYTCLHYTDVIAGTDLRHLKRIQRLKREMLEFQAYGTIAPANFSRWYNIRLIYSALLELNGVPEAIADVDHKINILSEYQRELESRRADLLTNLITAFGIVSILASVLTIIQILLGGDHALWNALILTVIVMCLVFFLALFRRRN